MQMLRARPDLAASMVEEGAVAYDGAGFTFIPSALVCNSKLRNDILNPLKIGIQDRASDWCGTPIRGAIIAEVLPALGLQLGAVLADRLGADYCCRRKSTDGTMRFFGPTDMAGRKVLLVQAVMDNGEACAEEVYFYRTVMGCDVRVVVSAVDASGANVQRLFGPLSLMFTTLVPFETLQKEVFPGRTGFVTGFV